MAATLEQIANYLEQNELKYELDAENRTTPPQKFSKISSSAHILHQLRYCNFCRGASALDGFPGLKHLALGTA
jgi:hypothetical protein